jgi:hypothetical protein
LRSGSQTKANRAHTEAPGDDRHVTFLNTGASGRRILRFVNIEIFRSHRRRGVHGRLGMFRATVENGQGQALQVRSPELADALASALNAAVEDTPSASSPPGVIRYATSTDPRGRGQTYVLAAERGRDAGRFGEGAVAVTENRELAERVTGLLNRLDPAHFKPPQKGPGFGWF